MKEQIPIEEQAAQLTQQQKETVLKVDKYGTLLLLLLTAAGVVLMCLGAFAMSAETYNENAYKVFQTIGAIFMAISLGVLIFIKIKFPYYSNKIAAYLRTQRK